MRKFPLYISAKRGNRPMRAIILLVAVTGTLCACSSPSLPQKEVETTRLPVYEVVKTGATASEAAMLARHLGIPEKGLLSEGGVISFVDTARYLSVPGATPVTSPLLEKAIDATRNKDASRKITPTVLNARATRDLRVLLESAAVSKTDSAFAAAGLTPQFAAASVGHHELSLYSKDGHKSIIHDLPIDTEVAYKFTDPNGYPIYGPGAQAQI